MIFFVNQSKVNATGKPLNENSYHLHPFVKN